jgi:competence protein ComEC
MLALSLLTLAVGLVSPWLAAVFNNTNLLTAKVLLAAIHTLAGLPGSHFYVAAPEPPGTLAAITVLDCASGGSVFFRVSGRNWLIDAGATRDGDAVVGPFLRSRGVNRLATAVLTHGDSDHLGGFADLLPRVPIDRALDSPLPDRSPTRAALLPALRAHGIPVDAAVAGDTFPLGPDAFVEILYPPAATDRSLSDDKALVLRLTVGRFRALFLADSGWPTELWLLEHTPDLLACNLLVKGNHRSGFSGSAEFLAAAAPAAIIVTSTDFPPHETPPADFLASAAHLGIPVFRQDTTGAVTIRVTATGFTLTPFLDPAAARSHPLR